MTTGNVKLVLHSKELSDVITRKLILKFQTADALFLGVKSTKYLYDECSIFQGLDETKDNAIESKLQTEESGKTGKFIDATVKEWGQKMPALSVDVLYIKEIQVTMKATEAANKKYFTKQDTLKATDDVAAALNKVDDSETASKPVQQTIRKEVQRATAKEVKKAMVKERSKDSDGAKMESPAPRPGNSG